MPVSIKLGRNDGYEFNKKNNECLHVFDYLI